MPELVNSLIKFSSLDLNLLLLQDFFPFSFLCKNENMKDVFILKLLHTLQEQRNLFWLLGLRGWKKYAIFFFFAQPWSFPNLLLADHQIKIKNVFFVDLVFLYCLIGRKFEMAMAIKKQCIVLRDLMFLLVTP